MPRVGGPTPGGVDADAVRVPGVYAALREAEQDRHARADPRWTPDHPGEVPPPMFRRDREHLDRLRRGLPVTVPRYLLGGWSVPAELPWERGGVRSVTVTADDAVRPAEAAG